MVRNVGSNNNNNNNNNIGQSNSGVVVKETGFVVEKIVDKRITAEGKVEYYIKWRGYPNSENSWEPEENCDCPAIIQKFEESRAKSKKRGEKKPKIEEIVKPRGYERGLKIAGILGATDATTNGEIFYLVEWESCPEYDLVSSAQLQDKNPEMLIEFYEKRSSIMKRLQEYSSVNNASVLQSTTTTDSRELEMEEEATESLEVESGALISTGNVTIPTENSNTVAESENQLDKMDNNQSINEQDNNTAVTYSISIEGSLAIPMSEATNTL